MAEFENIALNDSSFELYKIKKVHVDDLFEIYSDYEILHYTDSITHKTTKDTSLFVDKVEKGYQNGSSLFLGICLVEKNKLIGTVGIYDINKKHSFASIGCVLHKNYWRKGIMTDALQVLTDFAFQELDLNRLEAQVFENHLASANLFRKLSFVEEGVLRQNFLIDGKFENSIMFSKLKID